MRKIVRSFFMIILSIWFIFALSNYAIGCTCVSEIPLDWSTIAAENILLLKLKSLEKYQKGEEQLTVDGIKQAKLIVQKSFKGSMKKGQEVIFPQGEETDCFWAFSEKHFGREFLFFLGKKDSFSLSSICSHSNSLNVAAADLLYVAKYKKVFGKTRLSGMFYNVTEKKSVNPMWRNWNYKPIAGRKLRIVGKGVDLTVKTNKFGAYEIYDLPVGKYKLIPQEVKGYRILIPYNENNEVEVKAKRLVEQNVEYLVEAK